MRLCSDPDEGVRYESRVALGILGDDRCLSELIRMVVEHDDLDDAALLGLDRMMPSAFPSVDALFRRGDPQVRRGLVNLIGCVAQDHTHAGALALLELMAEDEDEFVRHEGRWWLQELKERGVRVE